MDKVMEKTLKKIGKRISAIRTDAGLSQEKFAAHIGVSRGYLSDIERGAREMSLQTAQAVCKRLRITSSALLGF
jgi:transcriptional regulator with XRE-family HTH domain